jgi:hypothetical protein
MNGSSTGAGSQMCLLLLLAAVVVIHFFQGLQLPIQFVLSLLQRSSCLGKLPIAFGARIALKHLSLGVPAAQSYKRMLDAQSIGRHNRLGHHGVRGLIVIVKVEVVHVIIVAAVVIIIIVIIRSSSLSMRLHQDKLFQHGG